MPTYNSHTDGPIELSYRGKGLLQAEREAVMETINAGSFTANDYALSRARAALARYMGELESRVERARAVLQEVNGPAFKDYLRERSSGLRYMGTPIVFDPPPRLAFTSLFKHGLPRRPVGYTDEYIVEWERPKEPKRAKAKRKAKRVIRKPRKAYKR